MSRNAFGDSMQQQQWQQQQSLPGGFGDFVFLKWLGEFGMGDARDVGEEGGGHNEIGKMTNSFDNFFLFRPVQKMFGEICFYSEGAKSSRKCFQRGL